MNKTTAAYYFHHLLEIITLETVDAVMLAGEFEVDESYLGIAYKGSADVVQLLKK